MGLTIHYKLSVAKNLSTTVVRELADRTARYAQKIGCAEIGEVLRADDDEKLAPLFVKVGRLEDGCFGHVAPKRGWLVEVCPGEGCESALFGLCQYPRRIPFRAGSIATGFAGGWLLKGHCKTQYAGEHGWEHFLKCHRQIISVLDFWRQLGVAVEVTDEGEYWETRLEEKLRAMLNRYDGLVAAVAGTLKDAADETDEKHSIESPIFARKDFERLEAEGQREFGRQMAQFSRMGSNSGWFTANRTENQSKRN